MQITTVTWENGIKTETVEEFTPSKELQEILAMAQAEDKITRPKNRQGLSSSWCSEERRMAMGLEADDECEFLCFPDNDACSCPVSKHHVHCVHGYITQIG